MGEIYRSLDVFLGTSRGAEEGFFLPAVEAMACGVPCVLTEVPCFTGYGEGQYALFAEPGDAQQIAEALVIVSKHPKVAAQLRHDGICVARKYTPENHMADLERAFNEILTEARGSSSKPPSGILNAVIEPSIPAAPPRSEVRAKPQPEPQREPQPRPMALPTNGNDLAELSQSLSSALHVASEVHASRGDYEEALHHVQAAVCIQPDDRALLSELGRIYYLVGQDRDALGVYDELLAQGDDSDLFASRAMVLYSMGDYKGAVESFQQSFRCAPATTELLNNLGVAQFQAGDREGARCSFEQALTIEPGHADATANLKSLAG